MPAALPTAEGLLNPAEPLVSIALCTYNGAAYLRAQLDSLRAQTLMPLEIVAVDDGSSDQTCAILREYASQDRRFRCYENPRNLGPTGCFERAMSLCRGGFIAPCDQDDIWHPDKLARLLARIGSCDVSYCDSQYIDGSGRLSHRRISDGRAMLSGAVATPFLLANSISGHAMLLRRDLFERARPFPDSVYYDWWLALCAAGRNGIQYVQAPLVRFRRHQDAYSSMGHSGIARRAESSRAWLEQRQALMRAYSTTGLRGDATASALAEALQSAIDRGRHGALFRLLWAQRRTLPRWSGIAALDSIRWQLQVLRKVRRAQREPVGDSLSAE